MPNGKPGDHPLTDIVVHGIEVFGEPIDARVRRLAAHPLFGTIRERLANVLWDNWPHWAGGRCNPERVVEEIEMCERLIENQEQA